MFQNEFNNCHGQWLAIVSGRFLPVRDISVSVEQDEIVQPPATMGKSPVQSVRETITVEFDTPRDPMLRGLDIDPRESVDTVFVNRKYQLLVRDTTVFIDTYQSSKELVWSLEVKGLTYELRER